MLKSNTTADTGHRQSEIKFSQYRIMVRDIFHTVVLPYYAIGKRKGIPVEDMVDLQQAGADTESVVCISLVCQRSIGTGLIHPVPYRGH